MLNMSVEELLALKEELQVSVDEEKSVSLSALLGVEEELLRRLSRQKKGDSTYSVKEIQKDFISHLLNLGAYTKTYYKRDGVDDQKALGKVLKYDRGNALAYYRLGLYAYRKKFFITAAVHFNNAIKSHNQHPQLSKHQHYQVLLYLQNSTLKVATEAEGMTKELEENMKGHAETSLDFSPIQKNVEQYESYLGNHVFIVHSEQGMRFASLEECEHLRQSTTPSLILLFSEDQQVLISHKAEVPLTIQQANILKQYLLDHANEGPVERALFSECFVARDRNGKVPEAVSQQAITRLKMLLDEHKLSHFLDGQEGDKSFLCIQPIEQF